MITIKAVQEPLLKHTADAYVFLLEHNFDTNDIDSTAIKLYPPIASAIKSRNFKAAAGSSLILTGTNDGKGVDIILLGLGEIKADHLSVEVYRRVMGKLVRIAENHKYACVAMRLPLAQNLGLSYLRLAQETATIVEKASYHFDKFITNPDRKLHWEFELDLIADPQVLDEVNEGIKQGLSIGKAINRARYWCDMPPSQLTPTILANQAKEMADACGLKTTILNQEEIIKLGMGGLYSVTRGSSEECRLTILEYKTQKPNAETICLVGKGITFDSGGLSIKPATAMETMKDDMAGAAVVLSTMEIIAQMKPEVNVVALAPMSENMTGGNASKPGDVIRFYNGKTAEVKNTDAEGRLILADALSYAIDKYKPNAIIDLATLTGACAHALGPFYCGLFSQHDKLVERVSAASRHSGDRVWRLPMDNDYKVAIKSDIADLCNIGSSNYKAGAITAAFFLQSFVGNTPWVHLDIAGTAFGVPDMSYLRPGATGFGIRLLVDLIKHWNQPLETL